jgi:tetratricopeptide (TPR) repeat protein
VKRCFRRLLFGLAAVLWLNAPAFAAADPDGAFDSANRLYEQGKFNEAVSSYEKLLRSGSVSPALYFNLGNALFKSGEIGRAVAAYRKAEQIAPRDPDVRANLQFVRDQIQGPTLSPSRWLQWLKTLTMNEWTVLVSIALWLWLGLLAVIQFRPAWNRTLRGFVLLAGGATIVLGLCLGAVLYFGSNTLAVVTAHDAAVRNGPLDEAQSAFTVHDGAELRVLDHKDNWLQVTADSRRIGWIKRDQVLMLPQTIARATTTSNRTRTGTKL